MESWIRVQSELYRAQERIHNYQLILESIVRSQMSWSLMSGVKCPGVKCRAAVVTCSDVKAHVVIRWSIYLDNRCPRPSSYLWFEFDIGQLSKRSSASNTIDQFPWVIYSAANPLSIDPGVIHRSEFVIDSCPVSQRTSGDSGHASYHGFRPRHDSQKACTCTACSRPESEMINMLYIPYLRASSTRGYYKNDRDDPRVLIECVF